MESRILQSQKYVNRVPKNYKRENKRQTKEQPKKLLGATHEPNESGSRNLVNSDVEQTKIVHNWIQLKAPTEIKNDNSSKAIQNH
jgi:hypothetical protein